MNLKTARLPADTLFFSAPLVLIFYGVFPNALTRGIGPSPALPFGAQLYISTVHLRCPHCRAPLLRFRLRTCPRRGKKLNDQG